MIDSLEFMKIRILFLLFVGMYSSNSVCSQVSRVVDERKKWEKVTLEARIVVSKTDVSMRDVGEFEDKMRLLEEELQKRREIGIKRGMFLRGMRKIRNNIF